MLRVNNSIHKLKIMLSKKKLSKHFGVYKGTGSKVLGRGKCFLMLVLSLATVAVLKRLVLKNIDLISKVLCAQKMEKYLLICLKLDCSLLRDIWFCLLWTLSNFLTVECSQCYEVCLKLYYEVLHYEVLFSKGDYVNTWQNINCAPPHKLYEL